MNISGKGLVAIISGAAVVIGIMMSLGSNDLGYRQVVKNRVTGENSVVFDQGLYGAIASDSNQWSDFMSYDFSAPDNSCDYVEKDGVKVQFQDGGKGVVCGMVRVALPNQEAEMIMFHKAYRSEEGARHKLMNQYIPKVLNLTAGLMTSKEVYATRRADFQSMVTDQLERGIYKTKMVNRDIQVDVDKEGKPVLQSKDVPEIVIGSDGRPEIAEASPFLEYLIDVGSVDIKQYDFEPKTIQQISDIREAEMAQQTAQSNAKKAYWQEQEVIAQGKKDVAAAKYKEEQIAAREIVQAEREKKVAELAAEKLVEVAKLAKEEAAQKALAAVEYKKEQILIGQGDAERNRLVVDAGATPVQKLDAIVSIAKVNADAQAKRQVPTNVMYMGGGAEGQLGAADDVQAILGTQLLKNMQALNMNMQVK